MARGNRLSKLRSVLKKLNSFNKQNCPTIAATTDDFSDVIGEDVYPVYVGKSRRRYLVSSHIIDHPLFKELAERSMESPDVINVPCEVVLFEHMLWMLENVDSQLDSLDELVEFYAC